MPEINYIDAKSGDVLLMVGTMKGASLISSNARREDWTVGGPYFPGRTIYAFAHVQRQRRNRLWAAVNSSFWGSPLSTLDNFGREWTEPEVYKVKFPQDSQTSLKQIWKITLLLILAMMLCGTAVIAQEEESAQKKQAEPQHKLLEFQMALMKRGPKWTPTPANDAFEIQKNHVGYVRSMYESGRMMIAGSVRGDDELVAVYIFRTKSADEARAWVAEDPAVVAGHLVPELHPWWSEDVMKKITTAPTKFTTAYLAFLTRGDKWTPEKTPATEAIQKAHLENIQKLADMKKLVVAGPFGDNGRLRGIFVFKVDSIEEARSLAATDPAVQAGRLALQIHTWTVPEGILP